LTYLLRPNVRQPDYRTASTLLTPPATDIDYSSHPETSDIDSDFVSDRDFADSDVEASTGLESRTTGNLEVIRETSSPRGGAHNIAKDEDEWSELGADIEADESNSEAGNSDMVASIASLSLEGTRHIQVAEQVSHGLGEDNDPDKTLTQDATNALNELIRGDRDSLTRIPHLRQPPHAINRRWNRNTSSPSRSPARIRRIAAANKRRRASTRTMETNSRYISFYDYLFS
jgi:hypothetical protein